MIGIQVQKSESTQEKRSILSKQLFTPNQADFQIESRQRNSIKII